MNLNLNELTIETDNGPDYSTPLSDYSTHSEQVTCLFRNLKQHLLAEIQNADFVAGAAAWLTDFDILDGLSKTNAAIVVQKEDFLRPDTDTDASSNWARELRQRYDRLTGEYRCNFEFLSKLSYCNCSTIDGVRCVGNHNADKRPAFPRMHNKFFVFCRYMANPSIAWGTESYHPYAVWTGSFNPTRNAGNSFENAVVIRDESVARAYLNEWEQIMALSESLNWESEWVKPDWRIGS